MYRKSMIAVLAVFAAILIAPQSQAGVSIGLSADEDGIKSFHLAIGEHYGVKEKEVVVVRGESPIIETASASASSTLQNAEMVSLPTPNRNPFYLSTTTPTVVPLGNAANAAIAKSGRVLMSILLR